MSDPRGRKVTYQDPEMATHSVLSHSMIIVVVVWQIKSGLTGDAGDSQSSSFRHHFFPPALLAFGVRPFFIWEDCPGHLGYDYLALSLVSI